MAEAALKQTPAAEPALVIRETKGAIARLTLNEPERLNPLSEAMMQALSAALSELAQAQEVKVIVLAAQGRAFCAGHDLKEMSGRRSDADRGRAYFERIFAQCSALMQQIVRHPRPIIAEVQGIATAAGCQLVASCDLAVASEAARFGVSGINIGLFCSTPMVALSRNLARKHALEMLLTGELISAEEASAMGLVNRVVSAERLRAETDALAGHIAEKPTAPVKIGKEAFYNQLEMGLADAYSYTGRVMVENMLHRDAIEGIGAFIEKREPKWGG